MILTYLFVLDNISRIKPGSFGSKELISKYLWWITSNQNISERKRKKNYFVWMRWNSLFKCLSLLFAGIIYPLWFEENFYLQQNFWWVSDVAKSNQSVLFGLMAWNVKALVLVNGIITIPKIYHFERKCIMHGCRQAGIYTILYKIDVICTDS